MTAYDGVMVGQIVEALQAFGGECHRRQVIDYLGAKGDETRRLESFSAAVIACFERHCAAGHDIAPLFRRRFGADSHRWSLGSGAAGTSEAKPSASVVRLNRR